VTDLSSERGLIKPDDGSRNKGEMLVPRGFNSWANYIVVMKYAESDATASEGGRLDAVQA
jgi:hypothetical protein